jgi:hypothetical protein
LRAEERVLEDPRRPGGLPHDFMAWRGGICADRGCIPILK